MPPSPPQSKNLVIQKSQNSAVRLPSALALEIRELADRLRPIQAIRGRAVVLPHLADAGESSP